MATTSRRNISEKIVDIIIDKIKSHELKPGDRLLNERDLAAHMGVSRVPLREAIKTLVSMGLVETHRNEGHFITDQVDQAQIMPSKILNVQTASIVMEMLRVRKIMETEAARLAAINATPEEIDQIRYFKEIREQSVEKRMQDGGALYDLMHDTDRRFHRAIALAAHNPIFVEFLDSIQESLELHQRKAASQPETYQRSSRFHNNIYQAIFRREPEMAASAMRSHIEEVEKAVTRSISKSPEPKTAESIEKRIVKDSIKSAKGKKLDLN